MRAYVCRLTGAKVVAMLALVIALGGGAHAASPSTVVPQSGRVDGHTYGQWLAKSYQDYLETPLRAPGGCKVVGDVELIPLLYRGTRSCSVPAGRAVYVSGWGDWCSTIEKPPFYGRTPAELKACARKRVRGFSDSKWTIDGKAVSHPLAYVKASPVFHFHMPRDNVLGLKRRSGRAAANGAGLLLRGLDVGSHVIHKSERFKGRLYESTIRLKLEG